MLRNGWPESSETVGRNAAKRPAGLVRNTQRAVKVEMDGFEGADRGWEISRTRALVGYILIWRLGYKLNDVANFLGRDGEFLGSRFAVPMDENQTLRKQAVRLLEECQE